MPSDGKPLRISHVSSLPVWSMAGKGGMPEPPLVAAVVIVARLGPAGVALGTLAARMLVRMVLVPRQALRAVRVRRGPFLDVVLRGALSALLFATACVLVHCVIADESWITFGLQVATCLLAYLPIAVFVLVPQRDRRRVLEVLRIVPGGAQR
jgi:hypothetical protein